MYGTQTCYCACRSSIPPVQRHNVFHNSAPGTSFVFLGRRQQCRRSSYVNCRSSSDAGQPAAIDTENELEVEVQCGVVLFCLNERSRIIENAAPFSLWLCGMRFSGSRRNGAIWSQWLRSTPAAACANSAPAWKVRSVRCQGISRVIWRTPRGTLGGLTRK